MYQKSLGSYSYVPREIILSKVTDLLVLEWEVNLSNREKCEMSTTRNSTALRFVQEESDHTQQHVNAFLLPDHFVGGHAGMVPERKCLV